MVLVVGGKNIISFGASYGLIPMLQIYTYLQAFMIVSMPPALRASQSLTSLTAAGCLPRRVCSRHPCLLLKPQGTSLLPIMIRTQLMT